MVVEPLSNSRAKLFIENILIYGFGSAMNMVIPFIMLPIVTRLLPSSEYYGINDMVAIFVSVGSAIATMGMYDAMYRFYFDKGDATYRKKVCSSTLFTLMITGFVVLFTAIIFRRQLSVMLFSEAGYASLIIIGGLNIWVTSINTIVSAPTRMRNQRLRFIGIQTIAPVIGYSVSIMLILKGEYVYSLPIASLLSNILVCIIFSVLNRQDFGIRCISMLILKPMLRFGIPLMPVFIFFWVLSSVGRIIISNTWGLEYTGIYAAAGKIAAVSQLIYAAFSGGWQYFAFSTMNDQDYVAIISKIFDYLAGLSFFAVAALILILKPLYTTILPAQYAEGISVVPALFLAPLLLMLRQTIGMHFQIKKMSILGTSTIGAGAAFALLLFFLLIPRFGINGAAVASLVGYLVTLMITVVILKKMNLIFLATRIYVGSFLTVVVLMLHMSRMETTIVYAASAFECIVLLYIYRVDEFNLLKRLVKAA